MDQSARPDAAAVIPEVWARFGLPGPARVVAEHHGGVNRVWQVATPTGTYAVHHLLSDGVDADVCGRIHRLEVAALDAGARLPRPVAAEAGAATVTAAGLPGRFTVHEWCDAAPVPVPPSPEWAASLGASVARVTSLRLDLGALPHDILDRSPTAADWRGLAATAANAGLPWATALDRAAGDLGAASAWLRDVGAASAAPTVWSHRDLTSANVLDDDGVAVLLDWESAGPVLVSAEVGRTALDNFGAHGTLDRTLLTAYLRGYASVAPLPAVGTDWCWLWIQGLVVFAEHCARSCIEGTAPPSLLAFQREVVESTPHELTRRLAVVDRLVDLFDAVVREDALPTN